MTRKALGRYGPRGRSVTLWVEADRITAQWRERGARRKRSWPNTAAHRKEARAWAEAFSGARTPRPAPVVLTTADLWARYAEAEFPTLRPRTQRLYADYWRAWSVYVAPESVAEDLGPGTMAGFRAALEARHLAPSTIGQTLRTVRTVYAWALRAQALKAASVLLYRYKVAKDKRAVSPAEYRDDELTALLAHLPLDRATTWRAGAVLALCGWQGARQNSVLHLRWEDVDLDAETVTWRAVWDKTGREWVQPLRRRSLDVLRAIQGYTGGTGWVFPANSTLSQRQTYSAQSLWAALRRAERMAGIAHQPRRAAHGLRRMLFNDVMQSSGDIQAAMAAIHDTDLRVASRYLKGRDDRVKAAFDHLDQERTDA